MSTKEIGTRTQAIIDGIDESLLTYIIIIIFGSIAIATNSARDGVLLGIFYVTGAIGWIGVLMAAEDSNVLLTAVIKNVSFEEAKEICDSNKKIKAAKAEQRDAEESAIMKESTSTSTGDIFVMLKMFFRFFVWVWKTAFLVMFLLPIFIKKNLLHKHEFS